MAVAVANQMPIASDHTFTLMRARFMQHAQKGRDPARKAKPAPPKPDPASEMTDLDWHRPATIPYDFVWKEPAVSSSHPVLQRRSLQHEDEQFVGGLIKSASRTVSTAARTVSRAASHIERAASKAATKSAAKKASKKAASFRA